MRPLLALTLIVMSLTLGVVITACSNDDVGADYYENDIHRGYPGPGTTQPNASE